MLVPEAGWPVRLCAEGGKLKGLALSTDGRTLWSAAFEGDRTVLRVWLLSSAACMRVHPLPAEAASLRTYGGYLYVGCVDGSIHRHGDANVSWPLHPAHAS